MDTPKGSVMSRHATWERSMIASDDVPLALTVTEVADLLRISRAHAYNLIARGELSHVRLGRKIVVPRKAVESLLNDVEDSTSFVT